MFNAGVFVKSVYTVLFTLFRGRYLALFLISVTVPSAILSVMMCTSSSLEAGIMLFESYTGSESLVWVNESLGNNCMEVSVSNVVVIVDGKTVNTSLYVVDNISKYIRITHLAVKGSINHVDGLNVSVGSSLAHLLNLSIGSQIRIIVNKNKVAETNVVAIHGSRGITNRGISDYLIIGGRGLEHVVNGTWLMHGYLCSMPRSHIMISMLKSISSSIDHLLDVMIILVISSYAAVIFSSLVKVSDEFSGIVMILWESGLSRRILKASYMASLMLIALVLSFFGLSLGVAVFHSSLWILRFLGLYLPVKPLPSVPGIALTLLLTSIATLLASYATSNRIFQEGIT